ncbi:MAG: Rieske (2Fe-2S) protein [bacterium]
MGWSRNATSGQRPATASAATRRRVAPSQAAGGTRRSRTGSGCRTRPSESAALSENAMARGLAQDADVLVARQHGRVCALAHSCAHLGGPLSEGTLKEGSVVCPWHGSEFALDTGDPLGLKTVLLTPAVDTFRLPRVSLLNARFEKKFMFGSAKIAIDFDVFNALNADTVLGKQYDARMTGLFPFGQVLEIMNPRIARLGFRLVF